MEIFNFVVIFVLMPLLYYVCGYRDGNQTGYKKGLNDAQRIFFEILDKTFKEDE